MALIQSTAIPSGATDYELEQSLKFNDDDSAYLSWTPASAGNRKTFTWSGWVKLSNTTNRAFFGAYDGSNAIITKGSKIQFEQYDTVTNYYIKTSAVLRDFSAWYHIVAVWDTSNSTSSDRIRLYINGERATDLAGSDYPALNYDHYINGVYEHRVGHDQSGSRYMDGYMAEVHFIDGQALTPADFGETGTYGEWKPIEYSGTYGTNGFYLNFAGGGVISATGGNSTTTDGDYKVASFTSNGTFTPSADGYVEYLVIGGGGGGAGGDAGEQANAGGGGGAFRTGILSVTGGTGYSITVGAGGSRSQGVSGGTGGSSVFSTITAVGGGGGGKYSTNGTASAGSGGGGGYNASGGSGGSYGNDGGDGSSASGGGGGGASAAGANASGDTAGNGGAGLASSITGSSVTYAGGGGGGTYGTTTSLQGTAGTGGSGGGGAGKRGRKDTIDHGDNGTANTGGGGGGAAAGTGITRGKGGLGGSGIVIIRYKFQ